MSRDFLKVQAALRRQTGLGWIDSVLEEVPAKFPDNTAARNRSTKVELAQDAFKMRPKNL